MPRLINACPGCSSAGYYLRSGLQKQREQGTEKFRCQECKATFNEPVKREAKHPSGPTAETMLRRAVE